MDSGKWAVVVRAGQAGMRSTTAAGRSSTTIASRVPNRRPGSIMPAVPGAKNAFVVAAVDPPWISPCVSRSRVAKGTAVVWARSVLLVNSRTRLIVRGRASTFSLAGFCSREATRPYRRIFIERAYALLAHSPCLLLIGFAAIGHRLMEARHLRGLQRRSVDCVAQIRRQEGNARSKALLVCGIVVATRWRDDRSDPILRLQPYLELPAELTAIGAPNATAVDAAWLWCTPSL